MADNYNSGQPSLLDPVKITDDYLNNSDWRRYENSTSAFCLGGLNGHLSGTITANYWLSKIYPEEISSAHKSCDLHIHDLAGLSPYCAGWGIKEILEEGLNGVRGRIDSDPPKHLTSAMYQIINYMGIMSNEWMGAQAFNNFDTHLAAFIKKDNLSDKEIEQAIQAYLWNINIPSRWAGQAPFTNITFDLKVPNALKEIHPIIGKKKMPFTYGELQPEIDRFNKTFFKIMEKGDAMGNIFQYPIPNICCTKEFFETLDPEVEEGIYTIASKYGIPYFSNYCGNTGQSTDDILAMCCRLRLDLRELKNRGFGLFAANSNTGSIGVVTLNMPKIGYLSHNEEELFQRIDYLMTIAKNSLEIKRKTVSRYFDEGLYPYTKRYLKAGFSNHFSTIGLVGMNEMCRNYFRNTKKKDWDISTKDGKALTIKILDYMREKCADYQEETGNLYNLESTPAESTSFRLAKHDKIKYPDIIASGTIQSPYYTNSSNLPVNYSDNPWDAIKHQNDIQQLYTGGTVLHVFLSEAIDDWKKLKEFIKNIMYNTQLPSITITPTFSHCQIHGYLNGDTKGVCPHCKEEALRSYNEKLEELRIKKENILKEKENMTKNIETIINKPTELGIKPIIQEEKKDNIVA
jgi:ribonucleoside-triphosphate reductase